MTKVSKKGHNLPLPTVIKGLRLKIHDLVSNKADLYNGKEGVVSGFFVDRYLVSVSLENGTTAKVAVRPKNLNVLSPLTEHQLLLVLRPEALDLRRKDDKSDNVKTSGLRKTQLVVLRNLVSHIDDRTILRRILAGCILDFVEKTCMGDIGRAWTWITSKVMNPPLKDRRDADRPREDEVDGLLASLAGSGSVIPHQLIAYKWSYFDKASRDDAKDNPSTSKMTSRVARLVWWNIALSQLRDTVENTKYTDSRDMLQRIKDHDMVVSSVFPLLAPSEIEPRVRHHQNCVEEIVKKGVTKCSDEECFQDSCDAVSYHISTLSNLYLELRKDKRARESGEYPVDDWELHDKVAVSTLLAQLLVSILSGVCVGQYGGWDALHVGLSRLMRNSMLEDFMLQGARLMNEDTRHSGPLLCAFASAKLATVLFFQNYRDTDEQLKCAGHLLAQAGMCISPNNAKELLDLRFNQGVYHMLKRGSADELENAIDAFTEVADSSHNGLEKVAARLLHICEADLEQMDWDEDFFPSCTDHNSHGFAF